MDGLDEEVEEDEVARAKFGTDEWSRPSSDVVNRELVEQAEVYRSTLSQAGESDLFVHFSHFILTPLSDWFIRSPLVWFEKKKGL